MSTTKVKGFHLPLQTIKFLEKLSKDLRQPESHLVDMLIGHFKNLSESEQKKILAEYLTKNL